MTKLALRALVAIGLCGGVVAMARVRAPGDAPTKAARSVHLGYQIPEAAKGKVVAFCGDVIVEQSVLGSYFMACGFGGGYFGIQERGDKKVGIFSVWDSGKGTNDKQAVEAKDRVKTEFEGEGVRVERFGGEGTGGHSDFDCNWEVGKTYRFYLEAYAIEGRTHYSAWFCEGGASGTWRHIATFSTPNGGKTLSGLYSFIEDFRRNGTSAEQTRRATFGNFWVKTAAGEWMEMTQAKFTASRADWEAKDTIDAGAVGKRFYLQTGGPTTRSRELGSLMELGTGK